VSAFRYLETGFGSAAFNMGLDEAVLASVAAGAPPTLRLYAWRPRAVSLGYFQGLEDEVDAERCAALGVDVVRRLTGGGAVYHADELTYSVVVPEGHPLAQGSILESYRALSAGVVAGLRRLGVEASFEPLNDICAGGKKLSGNAQTRRLGCVLQHGTVLLAVNPEEMFSVLRVPSEKLKGRLIEDVKARVGSVSAMLGRPVDYAEALEPFRDGFAEALEGLGPREEPEPDELRRADESAASRFGSRDWTARR